VCTFTAFAAYTTTACLIIFLAVNLHNLLKFHRNTETAHAEVKRPSGFAVMLAALGTVVFFVESSFYAILVFAGKLEVFSFHIPLIKFPYMLYVRGIGLGVMVFGYFLFLWSVTARGKYATSWEMCENHKLVTYGPYRYVRHPSYTGYFLMFVGFALTWLNLAALVPLMAIPGYVKLTVVEEKLLVKRFGAEYRKYQQRTGKFFPKILSKDS